MNATQSSARLSAWLSVSAAALIVPSAALTGILALGLGESQPDMIRLLASALMLVVGVIFAVRGFHLLKRGKTDV